MTFITDDLASNLWKILEPSRFYQETGKAVLQDHLMISVHLDQQHILPIHL